MRQYRLLMATFAIAALAESGQAQDVHLVNCANLSDQIETDYQIAFTCVGLLKGEAERLRSELVEARDRIASLESGLSDIRDMLSETPSVPAVGDHENTRAVVAYLSDKGQKTCPKGWSPVEETKNRFIVGAGDKYPTVGESGGTETVTLTEAQMPEHRHGIAMLSITANLGWKDGMTGLNVPYFDIPPSGSANNAQVDYHGARNGVVASGSSEPHNNMPPYIALYFCKKD